MELGDKRWKLVFSDGGAKRLARAEPVAVAKHGRPVVVVMAVEEFERLKALDAPATIYDKDRVLTGCRTMHRGLTRLVLAAILPAIVLCGCVTVAPVNVRVDRVGPETGYRIAKFMVRDRGPTNNPDALVLLAFSGGGTRAAALSYGVLEELRRTPIVVKGHQHSLLDEVDLIAGVSGGSFTALAYALYGERLFHEYQQRFLKRNVQGELIQRVLNPTNWLRLASGSYGRSELGLKYLAERLSP